MDFCKIEGCTNQPAGHTTNGMHVAAPVVAVSLIASADRLRDLAERLEALRAETASVEQALKDAYTELGQLV